MRLLTVAATMPLLCGVAATSQDTSGVRAEFGLASWYGYPFHGRTAANGETYNMNLISAAHRTLPLDSWVRVTNLVNSKSVDVRITDRGPFIDGRIIDLSRAAAYAIDLIDPGTARVRIDPISEPEGTPGARRPSLLEPTGFAVQVGAFRDRGNAERLRERMERLHHIARIVPRPGEPVIWRVFVGEEQTRDSANDLAGTLRTEAGSAFVVQIAEPTAATMAGGQ